MIKKAKREKRVKIAKYPLLSELTIDQLCHMAFRADRYTGFGLLQITRLCRGELGDMKVNEAFEKLDMSPHQAKCHATAVVKFGLASE